MISVDYDHHIQNFAGRDSFKPLRSEAVDDWQDWRLDSAQVSRNFVCGKLEMLTLILGTQSFTSMGSIEDDFGRRMKFMKS